MKENKRSTTKLIEDLFAKIKDFKVLGVIFSTISIALFIFSELPFATYSFENSNDSYSVFCAG